MDENFDFINDFSSFEANFDCEENNFLENSEDSSFSEITDNSFFAESNQEAFGENLNDDNNFISFENNDFSPCENEISEAGNYFSEETPPLGGMLTDILSGVAKGILNAAEFTFETGIDLADTTIEFWTGAAGGGIAMEMLGSDVSSSDYECIDFEDIFPQSIPSDMDSPEYLSADDFVNTSDYIETEDNFHFQECNNSCAIATVTDIANDFGIDVSEAELREKAFDSGVYNENEGGSNPNKLCDFIRNVVGDEHEVQSGNFDINDLIEAINNGNKVIMAVDPLELSNTPAGIANMIKEELAGREICNAGHAVELKGIQYFDGEPYAVADNPDPTIGGHNIMYPLDQYLNACADFKNFAIIIK